MIAEPRPPRTRARRGSGGRPSDFGLMPQSAVCHGLPPTCVDRDPFFPILRLWAFTRPDGAPTDRERKMCARIFRSTARRCVATTTTPLGAAGLLTRRVRAFTGCCEAISGATWARYAFLTLHRGVGAVGCHYALTGARTTCGPAKAVARKRTGHETWRGRNAGSLPNGIKIRVSGHPGAGQGSTKTDFERPQSGFGSPRGSRTEGPRALS